MAQFITIRCAYCNHEWREELERHQEEKAIYRGGGRGRAVRTRLERYHVNCPDCGELNIVEVQREVADG